MTNETEQCCDKCAENFNCIAYQAMNFVLMQECQEHNDGNEQQ